MKSQCEICGKTLVPIGNLRKNGKSHCDWYTRTTHKKCYQIKLERMKLESNITV